MAKLVRVKTLKPLKNNGVDYPAGKDDVLMEESLAQAHERAGIVEILSKSQDRAFEGPDDAEV